MWHAALHHQQSRGSLKKLNLGSYVGEGTVDVVRACGVRRADFLGDGLFTRVLQAGQVGLWQSCAAGCLCGVEEARWHTSSRQTGPGTLPQSGSMTEPGLQRGFSHAGGNKA